MYSLDILPIPDFPNYAATRGGVILRLWTQGGKFSGRTLRQYNDGTQKNPHNFVRPCVEGRAVKKSVHQLVAATWIGPCPEGLEVDHIDCDPLNNRASNLEYVTHKENVRRFTEMQRRHGFHILKEEWTRAA